MSHVWALENICFPSILYNEGKFMIAVRGIYQGGDTVKLDGSPVPIQGPYEVVVTFILTQIIPAKWKSFQVFLHKCKASPLLFSWEEIVYN